MKRKPAVWTVAAFAQTSRHRTKRAAFRAARKHMARKDVECGLIVVKCSYAGQPDPFLIYDWIAGINQTRIERRGLAMKRPASNKEYVEWRKGALW